MAKLPKVEINGRVYNVCPICGGHCTDWAWNEYRHCAECDKLIRQGRTVSETRVLRTKSIASNALTGDRELPPLDSIVETNERYDFFKTFPTGIEISVSNKEEAGVIREAYRPYKDYAEIIIEFPLLMGQILQSRLEQHRISKKLADLLISAQERKALLEIKAKLDDQMNKSLKIMNDFRDARQSKSMNIFTEQCGKMLQYLGENDQEYQGVGICPDCNQRIHFKTVFPTFRAQYEEQLKDIADGLRDRGTHDESTINELVRLIITNITDNSLVNTYAVKFTRQLEAALI